MATNNARLSIAITHRAIALYVLAAFVFGFCQSRKEGAALDRALPQSGPDFFLDITGPAGIDFVHTIGDHHLSNLVESVGGGAAWIDYDRDGFLDLYLVNAAHVEGLSAADEKLEYTPTNKLYRNLGDGTFSDVTPRSGVGDSGYGMGVSVGDYNNDGYPDIYLSNYGPNVLYKNNGDGTFSDVTDQAGVGGDACSVGAAWLDFDKDGLADLYVGNYILYDSEYGYYYAPDGFPGPMAFEGQPDRLYRNTGGDAFEDVTEQVGILHPEGRAMGVGSADYNSDGWMDIYVANDHMVNYLFRNNAGRGFTEVGTATGTAFNQVGEATISMAVDFADYNGDGLLDLFVSDDGYCSLFANEGGGVFSERSYHAGIASASGQHVGWATAFIDYDNDGDRDIFKVNGELKHLYGQEDQLFENDGTGSFTDVSVERGVHFTQERVSRGACFGDYDNDGDIDVYIVNLNDRGILLRNDHGNKNNWILLDLIGAQSNRDALGAQVAVVASGKSMSAQQKGGSGYLSQNDHRLHFGLGPAEVADSIVVLWPSGRRQVLREIEANQILTIGEE